MTFYGDSVHLISHISSSHHLTHLILLCTFYTRLLWRTRGYETPKLKHTKEQTPPWLCAHKVWIWSVSDASSIYVSYLYPWQVTQACYCLWDRRYRQDQTCPIRGTVWVLVLDHSNEPIFYYTYEPKTCPKRATRTRSYPFLALTHRLHPLCRSSTRNPVHYPAVRKYPQTWVYPVTVQRGTRNNCHMGPRERLCELKVSYGWIQARWRPREPNDPVANRPPSDLVIVSPSERLTLRRSF